MALTLAQTTTGSVTGVVDFGGYPINASGSLQGDRLQINGTGSANGVEYEYKSWNGIISGARMTGGFTFLEYLKSGGLVQYVMTLVNVVRTSTSTSHFLEVPTGVSAGRPAHGMLVAFFRPTIEQYR